ncbi:MAG: hypothetical protein K5686_09205 [Lachnospiraceae bacterium]|nr:hypothetical protein [Lachnospiraceae bacterium]
MIYGLKLGNNPSEDAAERRKNRKMGAWIYILSFILNLIFVIILRTEIYTDRFNLPDGSTRELSCSPIDRLYTADLPILLYLQGAFMLICLITFLLYLTGIKTRIINIVQLIALIASLVMFIIIMIVCSSISPTY